MWLKDEEVAALCNDSDRKLSTDMHGLAYITQGEGTTLWGGYSDKSPSELETHLIQTILGNRELGNTIRRVMVFHQPEPFFQTFDEQPLNYLIEASPVLGTGYDNTRATIMLLAEATLDFKNYPIDIWGEEAAKREFQEKLPQISFSHMSIYTRPLSVKK
ncbi:MAG: hypothetical protein HGA85_01425 [Nanoarchaeota archaeon]|nr:hypothetical protein [Nanoarchaeota archaeon]